MFLTGIAIAGGALITGSKVYRENKRKREKPWTVAYERLEKKKKKSQQRPSETFVTALTEFKGENIIPQGTLVRRRLAIRPFWNKDGQQKQRLEVANKTEEIELSGEEQEINHYLAFSGASLALMTAGALFYAPLTLLSVPALLYVSANFFTRQYKMIFKEKRVGPIIDFISAAGTLATGHYLVASLNSMLLYASQKLIIKTENHSRKSLINLFGTEPRFIWIQRDGVEVEIPFEALSIGDIVVAHAGEMILVDGPIVRGRASIDERSLTGESEPVEKAIGDEAFASTVVLSGQVHIQVKKAGADTVAAQIGEILNHTADFTSTIKSRADKVIDRCAVPTLALSALALPLLGVPQAMALLYASFGYHMRIAAPISVLNFLRIASQHGVLIKDWRSLELLSTVDTFVFDTACVHVHPLWETGPLTEEVPTVDTIYTSPEAQALVKTLRKRNISIYMTSSDHEAPTKKLAESLGIDHYVASVLPQDKARLIEQLQEEGKSVCFVGDGVNDSIALKKANVSISLCGASTIATDTAGIILMHGRLKSLSQLLDIANDLDRNLTTSTMMTIVPGLICVGGVFFFHFGLLTSILLYNAALALSVSNAMWPLFKHQREQASQSNSQLPSPIGSLP